MDNQVNANHLNLITFEKLFENAPGIVGKLAKYLNSLQKWECKEISLGAALTVIATLKCGYFSLQDDKGRTTHPNLYVFVLARTATGKTSVMSDASALLERAGLNRGFMIGKPASSAGLLGALAEQLPGHNTRLLAWDEIGIAFRDLAANNQSHMHEILGVCMELFSKAGQLYRGKIYSPHSGVQTKNIEKPFLNIFGASTPEYFFDHFSPEYVQNGLLPRWLCFVPTQFKRQRNETELVDTGELLDDLAAFREGLDSLEVPGNLGGALLDSKVCCVFDAPKTQQVYADHVDAFDSILFCVPPWDSEGALKDAIYARAEELYRKIIIVCSDRGIITTQVCTWAYQLIQSCLMGIEMACEKHLGTSEYERGKERIKRFFERHASKAADVGRNEWITSRELAQKISALKCFPTRPAYKDQAVTDLLEEGVIELEIKWRADIGKKIRRYRLVKNDILDEAF